MTDLQQTNAPATTPANGPQSGSAGTPSAAHPSGPPRSYAHATRHSVSTTPIANSSPSAVAPSEGSQHARQESVNSRGHGGNMAAPAIVNSGPAPNGAPAGAEHGRKQSVTITPQGTTGSLPNGGPATPSARPPIVFGQTNAAPSGSPSIANSQPQSNGNPSNSGSLNAPMPNPRITSPAVSPSPIPQPAASGGRPPAGLQNSGLSFGSHEGDGNRQMPSGPGGMNAPGPMTPNNAHFRRASTQSHHGDMSHGNMNAGPGRGGYAGRGRGGNYGQGYGQPMPYGSPAQSYRNLPGQQRPGSLPPQVQGQYNMGPQSSPHMGSRSPAPHMPSQPSTPSMPHMQMHHQQMQYPPSYQHYHQQLGPQGPQYPMQASYDPNYAYYQPPYSMPSNYYNGPPPQSPRQFKPQGPQGGPNQYMPNQYNQSGPQNMSRTSSQMSERPASSLGSAHHQQQPSSSATPQGGHGPSHAPSQSTSGAAVSSQFTIPSKVKKGVVIKNADGTVLNFDKKSSSPAAAPSPSPVPSSSAATPPPRTPSAASHSHTRSDSKSGKSAAEIKAEFQEQVKKDLEKDKAIKEETEPTPTVTTADQTSKAADEPSAKAVADQSEPPKPEEEVVKPQETAPPASRDAASVETAAASNDTKPTEPEQSANAEREETEEERFEREIAEIEANEKAEEEREAAYALKKKAQQDEKAAKAKEDAAKADEKLKQAERDAEALEEAREKEREKGKSEVETDKAERDQMFASLKRPAIGPGAEAESEATTPQSEDTAPTPSPVPSRQPTSAKPKPAALKLETAKAVEPAQPTPGMRSLRSARMLQLQSEAVNYPDGIQSPNPALNSSTKRGGRMYDKSFLMQFQEAFKEKPSLDWDSKLKETLGNPTDSASTPRTGKTPGGGNRNPSQRGIPAQPAMGGFRVDNPGGSRSDGRFPQSNSRGPANPMAFGRPGGQFPMGGNTVGMGGRAPSGAGMPGPNMSRGPGRQPSKDMNRSRGKPGKSAHEQATEDKKMPLTAKGDVKSLEKSSSGWVSASAGRAGPPQAVTDASGNMAPEMVQRKVKANLNKMTPERFDKIANQIMEIASQSRRESDGRTLRQVIALTFEKATDEAHWAAMYARFCKHMLEEMSPDIRDDQVTDKSGQPLVGGPLFRKYLLNRCQEEFERGWTVDLPGKKDGQTEEAAMMSDEYYEAAAAKRRGLGLVQFIGELYKLGMLSIRIMHECFLRLLDFEGAPDEAAIESLVKLLRTVGGQMQHEQQGPNLLASYFERVDKIINVPDLPSRMHFMLLDVIDLRKAGWESKDDLKGPKTITEIRQAAIEAAQKEEAEKARQNQRGGPRQSMGRDSRNFSGQMGPPPDYNRNQVGTDDLRRLQGRGTGSRQSSQTPGRSLGPSTGMFSRSGSGRTNLGPQGGLLSRGDSSGPSSGMHSRTSSVQAKKEDQNSNANTNAFSALAGMDGDGSKKTPVASPQMTKAQPATSDKGDSK